MDSGFAQLTRPEIARAAEDFLNEVGALEEVPIDVEFLVEAQGIRLYLEPGLIEKIDLRGFTTPDWSRIYIDEGLYQNEAATRFTLAHELGHYVLHKDFISHILEEHGIVDLESAYCRSLELRERPFYASLEKQCDIFAGMLLVPSTHLQEQYPATLEQLSPMIESANQQGLRRTQYLDSAIDKIASFLAPKFNVDIRVVEIRIREESLHEDIP